MKDSTRSLKEAMRYLEALLQMPRANRDADLSEIETITMITYHKRKHGMFVDDAISLGKWSRER